MSRIGQRPIELPKGVEFKINGNAVEVKGPKGTIKKEVHPHMEIEFKDNIITVICKNEKDKFDRSIHGLTRSIIDNMVIGVSEGFQKQLELVGVGYRAAAQGKKLVLNVGYSQPVEMDPGKDLEVEVPSPNTVIIKGIDKEKVGAFAANVRSVRPPEPYKGKGIKYQDEYVRRKAGKAGVKK